MTVQSRRGVLIGQFLVTIAIAAIAGWGLESWGALQSSPLGRLGDSLRLPVIALVVWGLGLCVAVTILKDSWSFRISFEGDHLLMQDNLGITRLHYDNISEAKIIPAFGAGIALKDTSRWLGTFEGKPSNLQKLRKVSGFTKGAYGCEVCITKKRLDIGPEKFVQEVTARIRT